MKSHSKFVLFSKKQEHLGNKNDEWLNMNYLLILVKDSTIQLNRK